MMAVAEQIICKRVENERQLKIFVEFPLQLYKRHPYFVPGILTNELKTLNPETSSVFAFCEARYWLAYKNSKVVGRVAAILNRKYNKERGIDALRFGWLDFEDDPEIVKALMAEVESYAKELGVNQIHGPLGFSSFDPSGVLVEGFDEMPFSFGKYNYPYYADYLEKLGFAKEIDWVEYKIKVPEIIPEQITRGAEIVAQRFHLKQPEIKKKSDLIQYANPLFDILNEAYSGLFGFSALTDQQKEMLKNEFLELIPKEYISVVLNEDDQLIGFGICLPSLSKALQKAKGKLFPSGWIHIQKALKHNDTVDLLLIGIKPEYQKKGVHAMIFNQIGQVFYKNGIKWLESTRELESNNSIQQLWKNYELKQHKRSRCYIKNIV